MGPSDLPGCAVAPEWGGRGIPPEVWSAGRGMIPAGDGLFEWSGWGPRPGPVIVLLHEGLGSVTLWRDFPARLAAATGWSVFAYSREGHGLTPPGRRPRPLDYMTREAVEVLPPLLDRIGSGRVVLLGHSDGATIASEFAGHVPDDRLAGLVLIAPHFFTEPEGLAEIARVTADFGPEMAARMAKYHSDPEVTFRGWSDAWLNPDFANWTVEDTIRRWPVPALVVQGEADQFGTAAQVDATRASPSPVTVRILPDCRHAPHVEATEELLAAVRSFLRALV